MDPVPPRNSDRVDGPIRAMSRTPSQEFLGPSGGLRPGGRPTAQQQAPADARGPSSQRCARRARLRKLTAILCGMYLSG